jgi:hypothetical protein
VVPSPNTHFMYSTAVPFPHVVLDDFPGSREALEAMPGLKDGVWGGRDTNETFGKVVLKKGKVPKAELFTEKMKSVFGKLTSPDFLKYLEDLTGIKGLESDPHYTEGGYHLVGNGGFLKVHADFSHHPITGLERRVNLLLYLNEGWKEEWGGSLLLCDPDKKPVKSILPVFGRCVIFTTSDVSFHGHPDPMKLPKGVVRKSLALYYYTKPTKGRKKQAIVF